MSRIKKKGIIDIMKIHLVQIHPELNDKRGNLDKILSYISQGLDCGANLVAFGELALNGCDTTGLVDYYHEAESIPGPSTKKIVEKIKGKHCLVVFGMVEKVRNNLYNSAALIGSEGIIGIARKLYLSGPWVDSSGVNHSEERFFKTGKKIAIFDTEFGRIGIQICMDAHYIEIGYAQTIAGCWLKIKPSAVSLRNEQLLSTSTGVDKPMDRKSCDCFINIVGRQGSSIYKGGTSLTLGSKKIKKQLSSGFNASEEVLQCEVDKEEIYAQGAQWQLIKKVRPDLIKQLWEIASNSNNRKLYSK